MLSLFFSFHPFGVRFFRLAVYLSAPDPASLGAGGGEVGGGWEHGMVWSLAGREHSSDEEWGGGGVQ